ncbi:TolC family protein [Wandonia haliotis]|uniref:TolC family protein n=1 Tax=Wandonia haliotis TaxID=574963 RepID=A0ABN1MSZ4_9FLAO
MICQKRKIDLTCIQRQAKRVIFVLFFVPAFSFSQFWTLDKCIDTALQNNLSLQSGLFQYQKAEIELRNARQDLLPSLNGGITHGYNWGQTIDLFTNQFATSRVMYDNFYLNSSITLFSGLQKYYGIQISRLNTQTKILEQQITERNVKIDVAAAFLQVLLNKDVVELCEKTTYKTNLQYQRVQEFFSENQATNANLLELNAQLERDRYTLTKARNDLAYSLLLLQQVLNVTIRDSFAISPSFGEFTMNTASADSVTFPEIFKIETDIQRQVYLIKSVKGRYYPTLILSGSLGSGYSGNNKALSPSGEYVTRPFNQQVNDNFYQSVFATLSIPIFNKNGTRNQVRIQELELKELHLNKQREYNEQAQKLAQLKMEISSAETQLLSLETVSRSARLNFEHSELLFETGNLTATELEEAKNKLFTAQSELLQTKYQLLFKKIILGFYLE